MASFQQTWFLAGGAAVALVATFPAHAEEVTTPAATMAESTRVVIAPVEVDVTATTVESTGFEMANSLTSESDIVTETMVPVAEVAQVEAIAEPEASSALTLDEYLAVTESAVAEDPFTTSAESFFVTPELAQSPESIDVSQDVAQVTRPLYRGVSPFYLGVGGNIGIIDSGKSAIGDFGFNLFGKVSLGPRFAVRPMLQFSEDDFNVALPVTFNFNPIDLGRFSLYPSLGGGVDFGDDIGLLVNGGIDVPISRDFTLNSQVNWRVTEDTGLGISLGVGYNFPLFFE
jgi:hypothetical protein